MPLESPPCACSTEIARRVPIPPPRAAPMGLALCMPLACKSVPLAPRNTPLQPQHARSRNPHDGGENRRSACSDSRSDAVCRRHGEKPPAASQWALQVWFRRSCYLRVQQGSAQTGRHYPHRRFRPTFQTDNSQRAQPMGLVGETSNSASHGCGLGYSRMWPDCAPYIILSRMPSLAPKSGRP